MLCALGAAACAEGTPIDEGDLIISPLLPDAGVSSPDASTPPGEEKPSESPQKPGTGDAGDTATPPKDPQLAPPATDGGAADAAPSDGGL